MERLSSRGSFQGRLNELRDSLGTVGKEMEWSSLHGPKTHLPVAPRLGQREMRAIKREEAHLWLSSGSLRYNRLPFMAGVASKSLKPLSNEGSNSAGWQARFMKSHNEEFEDFQATPWLPPSDQALLAKTTTSTRTTSRHAPVEEPVIDATAEDPGANGQPADVSSEAVAQLQHILFIHDQNGIARGRESECRPLAADAVLRHSPPYRFSSPPPATFPSTRNDGSWGQNLLEAILKNSIEDVVAALECEGADLDAVMENDRYEATAVGSPSRHASSTSDWERDCFGGCEVFARSADGSYGVRGKWTCHQDNYTGEEFAPLVYEIGDTALLIAIRSERWRVAAALAAVM